MPHVHDPADFAARMTARAEVATIRQRQKDAVAQANAANSVPALRAIVAQLAADVARLTEG